MFQLRAPKCPNCHAPLRAGREVFEIDCGYCGAHVQVRKPKQQKQNRASTNGGQRQSKRNNRGWKREIPPKRSAKRSGVATVLTLVTLVLLGSSVIAGWLFYSAQVKEESSSQGKAGALVAMPATDSTSLPATEVGRADNKKTNASKKKSRKTRHKKSKRSSRKESLLTPKSEERTLSKGKLTKSAAGRILRSVRMLHCSASGKVSVSTVIAASGKVQSAQVSGDMLASEATCISDTVKALRFPPSDDGLRIVKRYVW